MYEKEKIEKLKLGNIQDVKIPSSVTEIGKMAFHSDER